MNSVDKLLVHHAVLGFLFVCLFFWWIGRGMELIQFLLFHWLATFQAGSWVSASSLVRDGIIILVLKISQLYRSHKADIHRVSHRIMAVKPFEIQETLCSPHLQETHVRVREVRQTNVDQPTQTPGQSMFENQLFGRHFNLSLKKKAKNGAVG